MFSINIFIKKLILMSTLRKKTDIKPILRLERTWKKKDYTIGRLFFKGQFFCNTIEDTDRGLTSDMTVEEINDIKIPQKTAIPTGIYRVDLNTVSPKYSKKDYYKKLCDGKLPRLENVKGYDGILIHCGNTAEDSAGCVIVGENKAVGKVLNSRATFERLLKALYDCSEEIFIEII